jgi:hypothetical protein
MLQPHPQSKRYAARARDDAVSALQGTAVSLQLLANEAVRGNPTAIRKPLGLACASVPVRASYRCKHGRIAPRKCVPPLPYRPIKQRLAWRPQHRQSRLWLSWQRSYPCWRLDSCRWCAASRGTSWIEACA